MDSVVGLGEFEAALVEESLDVLELGVVLLLVLDLTLQGLLQLLGGLLDLVEGGEGPVLLENHRVDGGSGHHLVHSEHGGGESGELPGFCG